MHRLRLALQLPKLDHPGVLRLGFSIRNLIRCITKVIGGDSFGVSWLDVEEVSKPSWQFVEYTFANVAATISLVKEFGISTAIRPGFSGFMLRICRCRVHPYLQQERSWSYPRYSIFVSFFAYFGVVKNIVGFDPGKVEGAALELFSLQASTYSGICRALTLRLYLIKVSTLSDAIQISLRPVFSQ